MNLAPQNLQQVALLYICNLLSVKPRNDLSIYKSIEIKSTFIKIFNPKKTNVIVDCIYCHPHMDLNEFSDCYLNNLLDKLSKESKTVFLLCDFNIDLLNYENHSLTNEVHDLLSSYMVLRHIVQLTRKGDNSKTLIDNIYSIVIIPNNISGNITATISDNLPQFLIAPNIFSNTTSTKLNIFERDWFKFDQENFILDYLSVKYENLIKSNNGNVGQSFVSFLTNSILDFYASLKKISKQKLKFRNKAWITLDLQKSIKKFPLKPTQTKRCYFENKAQIQCKQYINLLSTLMKKSKISDFTNYFQNNLKDLKSTWKGLKESPNVVARPLFLIMAEVKLNRKRSPMLLTNILLTLLLTVNLLLDT